MKSLKDLSKWKAVPLDLCKVPLYGQRLNLAGWDISG
jgi:pterin-4a-carbinolamine dehydratase